MTTPGRAFLFLTSGLGDNLLTLPLALELEAHCRLTAVAPAGTQSDFFRACLPQARVISIDRSFTSLFKILQRGWRQDIWIYPISVCNRRLRLLHLLAPAHRAIGFTSLTSQGAWQAEIGLSDCLLPNLAQPAWKNNLRLLRLLDVKPQNSWTSYTARLQERLQLSHAPGSARVVIHPGSAHYTGGLERYKRWPLERFMEVARRLLEKGHFREVVWFLGQDDQDIAEPLRERLTSFTREMNMRVLSHTEFRGDLRQLLRFLADSDYLLSNDTGLAHLATLIDLPMTCLLSGLGEPRYTGQNGPHSQLLWEPVECAGCAVGISGAEAKRFQCPNAWACMNQLTVERVFNAVENHLGKHAKRAIPA